MRVPKPSRPIHAGVEPGVDGEESGQMVEQLKQTEAKNQSILDRTRFLINEMGLEEVSFEKVAARLCLSPRSLHRHLAYFNVSYKQLLEDERKRLALEYIHADVRPMEKIAKQLGYQEASSFSRAFKHWYGVAPKHYKQFMPYKDQTL